eukprot:TRINITY_DN5030_c1_g1_i2.p1 TRINITY_DN5030_c1_g1~~TRINITY_DN5030_c1_g1_i2.p1  ORF type:complete len:393 (+),score=110.40 TRINITY_DN5030_c1_g1_i2:62-1180(+)
MGACSSSDRPRPQPQREHPQPPVFPPAPPLNGNGNGVILQAHQQQQQPPQQYPQGPLPVARPIPAAPPERQRQHRHRRSGPRRRDSFKLAPEVTDARTVRNHVNVPRQSLRLSGESLEFTVDCDLPCWVRVYVLCEERGEREGSLRIVPQKRPGPASRGAPAAAEPVWTTQLDAGSGQAVHTPPLRLPTEAAQRKPSPCRKKWPVCIALECKPPGDEHNPTGQPQLQLSYVGLHPELPSAHIEAQKLQIGSEVFALEDIFGAIADERRQSREDGEDGGSPTPSGDASVAAGELATEDETACVVCLTEPRDTLIMPCRHMCLCSGCASSLRKQMNKCPICRTRIESMLKTGGSCAVSPTAAAGKAAAAVPPEG